jgi:hypothetical protein
VFIEVQIKCGSELDTLGGYETAKGETVLFDWFWSALGALWFVFA